MEQNNMKPVLHLAPLHGVTNYILRNTFFEFFGGFDAAMAPFIFSKHPIDCKNKLLKDILPENNKGMAITPQILSNDPTEFLSLAHNIIELGYDEINWNLGCPYKMVANKQRGSGLLPLPQRIDAFLEAVIPALKIPLSLKIRLGRERPEEIYALIPIFNKYPLKKIIIHPRTGIQMYDGKADVDAFIAAAKLLKHPVMYNGDITSLAVFNDIQMKCDFVNEWMIGRGALRNPFLPSIIKNEPIPSDKTQRIRKYHDELFARYVSVLSGPGHVMDKMKEIWGYLGFSFTNSEIVIKKISRANSMQEFNAAVDYAFDKEHLKTTHILSSEE
jgi:tRNA-dihydrouridine synthase B